MSKWKVEGAFGCIYIHVLPYFLQSLPNRYGPPLNMCFLCRLSKPQDMCSMITDQTANLVSNQLLLYLKCIIWPLANLSIALPLIIPQIACRVTYVMVKCLIDAVHQYIMKNMGTNGKRPSTVNKILNKRLK